MIILSFFPAHFFHQLLSKPFLPCSPCPEQPHPLQQPILPITFSRPSETCPDPPPSPVQDTSQGCSTWFHTAEACSQPRERKVPMSAPRGVPLTPLPLLQQGPGIPWPARNEAQLPLDPSRDREGSHGVCSRDLPSPGFLRVGQAVRRPELPDHISHHTGM